MSKANSSRWLGEEEAPAFVRRVLLSLSSAESSRRVALGLHLLTDPRSARGPHRNMPRREARQQQGCWVTRLQLALAPCCPGSPQTRGHARVLLLCAHKKPPKSRGQGVEAERFPPWPRSPPGSQQQVPGARGPRWMGARRSCSAPPAPVLSLFCSPPLLAAPPTPPSWPSCREPTSW